MRGTIIGFIALAVGGGLIGAALLRQRETNVQLRAGLELRRAETHEFEALRTERQRLEAAALPAAELERLRADHAAVARLRVELDSLKRVAREIASPPDIVVSPAPPRRAVPTT